MRNEKLIKVTKERRDEMVSEIKFFFHRAGSMQIGDLPISLRSFETRFLDNPKTLDQILNYLS